MENCLQQTGLVERQKIVVSNSLLYICFWRLAKNALSSFSSIMLSSSFKVNLFPAADNICIFNGTQCFTLFSLKETAHVSPLQHIFMIYVFLGRLRRNIIGNHVYQLVRSIYNEIGNSTMMCLRSLKLSSCCLTFAHGDIAYILLITTTISFCLVCSSGTAMKTLVRVYELIVMPLIRQAISLRGNVPTNRQASTDVFLLTCKRHVLTFTHL